MTPEEFTDFEEFPTRIFRAQVRMKLGMVFVLIFIKAWVLFCAIWMYHDWGVGYRISATFAGLWGAASLFFFCWLFIRFNRERQQTLTLNRDSFTITRGKTSKTFDHSNIMEIDFNEMIGQTVNVKSSEGIEVIDLQLISRSDFFDVMVYFNVYFESCMNNDPEGYPKTRRGERIVMVLFLLIFISIILVEWDRDVVLITRIRHAVVFGLGVLIMVLRLVHMRSIMQVPRTDFLVPHEEITNPVRPNRDI